MYIINSINFIYICILLIVLILKSYLIYKGMDFKYILLLLLIKLQKVCFRVFFVSPPTTTGYPLVDIYIYIYIYIYNSANSNIIDLHN